MRVCTPSLLKAEGGDVSKIEQLENTAKSWNAEKRDEVKVRDKPRSGASWQSQSQSTKHRLGPLLAGHEEFLLRSSH